MLLGTKLFQHQHFGEREVRPMKILKLIVVAVALVGLSAPVTASTDEDVRANQSIWMGAGFNDWRAVSRDELIIWATPSRPYLVKIWRPSTSLRFVNTIGVTSSAGRVTKFDNIIVDGQRLPIKSIKALDRQAAKDLRWSS